MRQQELPKQKLDHYVKNSTAAAEAPVDALQASHAAGVQSERSLAAMKRVHTAGDALHELAARSAERATSKAPSPTLGPADGNGVPPALVPGGCPYPQGEAPPPLPPARTAGGAPQLIAPAPGTVPGGCPFPQDAVPPVGGPTARAMPPPAPRAHQRCRRQRRARRCRRARRVRRGGRRRRRQLTPEQVAAFQAAYMKALGEQRALLQAARAQQHAMRQQQAAAAAAAAAQQQQQGQPPPGQPQTPAQQQQAAAAAARPSYNSYSISTLFSYSNSTRPPRRRAWAATTKERYRPAAPSTPPSPPPPRAGGGGDGGGKARRRRRRRERRERRGRRRGGGRRVRRAQSARDELRARPLVTHPDTSQPSTSLMAVFPSKAESWLYVVMAGEYGAPWAMGVNSQGQAFGRLEFKAAMQQWVLLHVEATEWQTVRERARRPAPPPPRPPAAPASPAAAAPAPCSALPSPLPPPRPLPSSSLSGADAHPPSSDGPSVGRSFLPPLAEQRWICFPYLTAAPSCTLDLPSLMAEGGYTLDAAAAAELASRPAGGRPRSLRAA